MNAFTDSPPFGLYDIFNYLIYNIADYDKQGLARINPSKNIDYSTKAMSSHY